MWGLEPRTGKQAGPRWQGTTIFFFFFNAFEEQFPQKMSNLLTHKDEITWTVQRMKLQVCLTCGFVLGSAPLT